MTTKPKTTAGRRYPRMKRLLLAVLVALCAMIIILALIGPSLSALTYLSLNELQH